MPTTKSNTHSDLLCHTAKQTTAKTKPLQPLYNNMTLPITSSIQNLAFLHAQTLLTGNNDDDHEAFDFHLYTSCVKTHHLRFMAQTPCEMSAPFGMVEHFTIRSLYDCPPRPARPLETRPWLSGSFIAWCHYMVSGSE